MVNINVKYGTRDYWDFDVHTLKMKKTFWSYLIARRKRHLDTTIICTAAREEGIEMYNTSTPEALKIVKQLQEDLKEHYRDHKTKRDEYLCSKENLDQDADEEKKAKYVEDAEFKWEDPKQVDKDLNLCGECLQYLKKIEFFLLKCNQLHFGQSEHESTPFTIETMQQKFDWNTLTEEAEEVLQGTYDGGKDEELTEIMKLVLTNCVQISPSKINPEITVAQLRGEMKVRREGTTTSPSGRNLGHYKVYLRSLINHLNVMREKN